MRDLKKKFKLFWLILKDDYTYSKRENCWWLWDGATKITFNKEEFK